MQWTTLTCKFHERSPGLKSCDIVNITSCVYDIGFSTLCFCAVQNNIIRVQYMTHFMLLLRNISLVGLAMKRQYMFIGINIALNHIHVHVSNICKNIIIQYICLKNYSCNIFLFRKLSVASFASIGTCKPI